MSRRKKHEHVNHERWLVSYADFITLLFAFFVVLFATSQKDKKKQQQLAAAIQVAFAQKGSFDPHSLAPARGQIAFDLPLLPRPKITKDDVLRAQICDAIGDLAKAKHGRTTSAKDDTANDLIHFRTSRDGLVLSLQEAGFFDSGSADLHPNSLPLLHRLASILPPRQIRVEGHTDNIAMHTSAFHSNWELSTARAAAIAHLLLEHSRLDPAGMSIAGYGEYHPIADNRTAQGREMNRRVDIVLLHSNDGEPTIASTQPTIQPATAVATSSHPAPSR